MEKVAILARVSTQGQDYERQVVVLGREEHAKSRDILPGLAPWPGVDVAEKLPGAIVSPSVT